MDWIHVKDGLPDQLKVAILAHASVTKPEQPKTFTVRLAPIDSGGHAVVFDAPPPPYAFANLVCWLDNPPRANEVSHATGWFTSPASGVRYSLRLDESNPSGDTLIGTTKSGESISVYLPDLSIRKLSTKFDYIDDAKLVPKKFEPVMSFEVVFDVDESFGNPRFELTENGESR